MQGVVALLVFPAFGLAIAAIAAFDGIVRTEFENHRSEWEADGQPGGFGWLPPEREGLLRSMAARNRLSLVWLFRTPGWALDSPDLLAQFKRLRLYTGLWDAAVVILIVLMFSIGRS